MEKTKRVFTINVKRVEWGTMEIVAETKEEAMDKANECYEAGQVRWGEEEAEFEHCEDEV